MNWAEANKSGMTYAEYQQWRADQTMSKTQQEAIWNGIERYGKEGREFRIDDGCMIAYGEVFPYRKRSREEQINNITTPEDDKRNAVNMLLWMWWQQGKIYKQPHISSYFITEPK